MKPLLMAHGEKILLGAVILLGGYLVVGAVGSLMSPTTLTDVEKKNLEKVQEALEKNKPPKRAPLTFVKHLSETFAGRSELQPLKTAGVVSPTHSGSFYGLTDDTVTTVDGTISQPSVFSATPSRGKVSLSWMACEVKNVAVERYEIYRKSEGQDEATLLTQTDGVVTGYDDTKVKPETEYEYYLQAVGRPNAPPGKTVVNVRTASTPVKNGLWYPPRKGPTKALVPSDIEFECSQIIDDFGTKRAVIVIKRWNGETNDWDRFKSNPAIAVGEPVVGHRAIGPMRNETFDSGYVLVKIEDFVKITKKKKIVFVLGADGIPVRQEVEVEIEIPAQRIVLRKGDKEVTVEVGTSKSTMSRHEDKDDTPIDNRPAGGGSLLDQIKEQMGARQGGGTSDAAATAAQPGATKIFSSTNGFKFKVPVEWANATIDLIEDGAYGDTLKADLKDGFDKALKTSTPDGLIVVQHHAMKGVEFKAFVKDHEGDDAQVRNLGQKVLIPRMQAVVKGLTAMGEPTVVYSSGGAKMAGVVVSAKDGDAEFVVARYCVASLPNLHLITFVCRKADYDAQKDLFEEVVKSLGY